MMKPKLIFLAAFCLSLLAYPTWAQQKKPVKVEIKKTNVGYTIKRGGKPYFIKGAGGTSYIDRLKQKGGNSIRTWSTDGAKEILDQAQQLGLTVTMGIRMGVERHGFDYSDPKAVQAQLERVRQEILQFKDHPALLAWGIGNELNLHYSNPKVWDAVNEVAQMIHEVDPNHLVTTMLAGINQKEIDLIKAKCPALDLLSVQVYGGLAAVPAQIKTVGWEKPYMVTEWGPTGHWEGLQTPWKASIEESSSEKAAVYRSRYEASIAKDKQCVGSYVFLWGQKQERTPTWYGVFTEAGEENEVVDVMEYLWTGKYPKNRAPHIKIFQLDGRQAQDMIYVDAKRSYPLNVMVHDPNHDKLTTRWELLPESTDLKEGGDRESRPQPIAGLVKPQGVDSAVLTTPEKAGAYRIFVYVTDGKNKVATANIPFYVGQPAQQNTASTSSRDSLYAFSTTPTWADEFDRDGLPDTSKWSYDVGSPYNGWGNNEWQYYTKANKENVEVSDGLLKITARKGGNKDMPYTSTRLVSKGKGDFRYGRFETRARVPQGRGTWPAVWMLPSEWKYGGWPNSGEIDILEHVGYDQDVVHISTHSKAYHHSINTQKTAKTKLSATADDFHVYRVDWTPDYITGFVDNVEIFHFANEKTGFEAWPFDQKFHWLINLAIGGNWGGAKGVDDDILPAVFEVDYVRVYPLAKGIE
ncbi:glycoside hydrolase family 16 protein [Sphingobacterium paludis]|nr:glycoside hydrolase family 16 protein [Sphingobacterium paludis]